MRRQILLFTFALTALLDLGSAQAAPPLPTIHSAAALVINQDTDAVLYARNADDERSIASLTKLLAAMVVLDEDGGNLQQAIVLTADDIDTVKNTRSRLAFGKAFSREQLLSAMLLASDNRAALALARVAAGGREAFVARMQHKAHALGMSSSHFADPAGLSADNRAAAQDVALLLKAAADYPLIQEVTTQGIVRVGKLQFRNTNPLAASHPWQLTLSKTGYTLEAGRCIAVQMVVDGHRYAIVLLGAPSAERRTKDLLGLYRWLVARQTRRDRIEFI